MRMLGKIRQPFCGSRCCGERGKAIVRRNRRRERQALRNTFWRE